MSAADEAAPQPEGQRPNPGNQGGTIGLAVVQASAPAFMSPRGKTTRAFMPRRRPQYKEGTNFVGGPRT